jgi:hypothetical protein
LREDGAAEAEGRGGGGEGGGGEGGEEMAAGHGLDVSKEDFSLMILLKQ